MSLKSIVYKYDARARRVDRTGLRDQNNIVHPGNAGLQKQQLFPGFARLCNVAKVKGKALHTHIHPQLKPFSQRREKLYKLDVNSASYCSRHFPAQTATALFTELRIDRLTHQRVSFAAKQTFSLTINVGKSATHVKRYKSFRNAGKCCAQSHGDAQGLLLGAFFFCQILQDALHADHRTRSVDNSLAHRTHPQPYALA